MISSLLTDFYQFTMAYGYWKLGLQDRETVFHLIYRKLPFRGNYAISCGLATVIDFLKHWRFTDDDLTYLSTLKQENGKALFPKDFLDYLNTMTFDCDVDALPEGTLVFTNEPLIRIKGPLIQGQLIESALLNIVNFQTLIATKASRAYTAAGGDPIIEFGLRRSQGPNGALSASRAAYIGGCTATSNVLAGKLYDIPVRGTHAHSWVTVFDNEIEAFSSYANVMPDHCVLLVDTYDTLEGVKHAITIGCQLAQQGKKLRGIRLDSGDLAALSIKARQLLDDAGFLDTKIMVSNSLDEYVIARMKAQGARVDSWGVGTNLMTAYDHPALDGVYKLSAIRDATGKWIYKIKISEQVVKISNPGIHQIRRYFKAGIPIMDMMYDIELGMSDAPEMMSFDMPYIAQPLPDYDHYQDLLIPIFRKGQRVYQPPLIHDLREKAIQQFVPFVKAYPNQPYVMGLEKKLHELKQLLIKKNKK